MNGEMTTVNTQGRAGLLNRFAKRLNPSAGERPTAPAAAGQPSGAGDPPERLCDCALREEITVVGDISILTLNPQGIGPGLEAELDDGSGTVRLVWMGRETVPGIEAGRRLRVTGRLTLADGRRTIFNPKYQLLSTTA